MNAWLRRHGGERDTRRAVCEERNERDRALVKSITVLAERAHVPREDIDPLLDALEARDCAKVYP